MSEKPDAILVVRRMYPVPRTRLFRAWSDPADLATWFAPRGLDTPVAEIDFRIGGRYRFGMRPLPDGALIFVSGAYREIVPDQRIVFTWTFERPTPSVRDTVVTVDLLDALGGSELVLTHELLPNRKEHDGHSAGWISILEKLATALNTGEAGIPTPGREEKPCP